jgi:Flp pilus assembly protein TadD
VLAELGDPDQALQYFRRAAEAQPTSSRALFYLGGLLVQMGRSSEAERVLRKALELGPSNREKQQILAWLQEIQAAPAP